MWPASRAPRWCCVLLSLCMRFATFTCGLWTLNAYICFIVCATSMLSGLISTNLEREHLLCSIGSTLRTNKDDGLECAATPQQCAIGNIATVWFYSICVMSIVGVFFSSLLAMQRSYNAPKHFVPCVNANCRCAVYITHTSRWLDIADAYTSHHC